MGKEPIKMRRGPYNHRPRWLAIALGLAAVFAVALIALTSSGMLRMKPTADGHFVEVEMQAPS